MFTTRKLLSAVAAAVATLTLAAPAHAVVGVYDKYFVTTEATAGAPGGNDGVHYYNQRSTSISALPGADGSGRGTFSSAGSSTDTTGRLTSAVSNVRADGIVYGGPTGTMPDGSYSQTRAAVDLSTASLHLSVDNDVGGGSFVQGTGFAQWHDILNFSVAGATASTVTRLTVELTIDGNWVDTGGRDIYGNPPQGDMGFSFYMDNPNSAQGNYYAANGWIWEPREGSQPFLFGTNDGGGWGSWVENTTESMRFVGTVEFTGASAIFNPTMGLTLNCTLGADCDYGNTAKLRFIGLDSSVSFTSDSGVFLEGLAVAPPVPEPGTYALMLAGLAGVGFVARRRSASAAQKR